MPEQKRVVLSWSSGKDSAWALHKLMQSDIEVVALLTTFNGKFDRVAMHGVRRSLVEAQAEAADIPLFPVDLPWPCSNEDYEKIMASALLEMRKRFSPTHVAFGDLFLEDILTYREKQMEGTGIDLLFPLWNLDTAVLAEQMISQGLRAIVACVDSRQLSTKFSGRHFDKELLADLPANVDPCGENGEFHTCVYAGPMFRKPLGVTAGPQVNRDGFAFADIDFAESQPA